MQSVEEVVAQIEKLQPQTKVNIVVLRRGQEKTIPVTLAGDREAADGLPRRAVRPPLGAELPGESQLRQQDWLADQESLKKMLAQLRDELSELRQEVERLRHDASTEKKPPQPDSVHPGTSGNAAPQAHAPQSAVIPPAGSYLAQNAPAPYFRGTAPRFRNYQYQYPIPPTAQPDSYFYYRRPPYYYNFAPPYAYPYTLPYYTPGPTPQIAPDIYPRYQHRWH